MKAIRSMSRPAAVASGLFVLTLACNRGGESVPNGGATEAHRRVVEDAWVTIDGVDFPPSMARAPAEIQEAYVFAAQHPEVLKHMPCYCGCQHGTPPHISNYDCFVDQIDHSGERPRVVIDEMGFG